MKRIILGIACAVLLAAGFAVPAQAGSGPSQYCNNGDGNPVPIVSWPINIDLEYATGLTVIWVCYSTTPWGDPGPAITGGIISINVAGGHVQCDPDPNVAIAVSCNINANGSGISVSLTPRVQTISQGVSAAVGGTPRLPACWENLSLTVQGTLIAGPFDVGIC